MLRRSFSNFRLRRNNDDDITFLHQDFQPNTPASKVNLQTRFQSSHRPLKSENQYENWRPPPRKNQIYENQTDMVEAMDDEEDSAPPPLPPRNHAPFTSSQFHQTNIVINTSSAVNNSNQNLLEMNDDDSMKNNFGYNSGGGHSSKIGYHTRSSSVLSRLSIKPFSNVKKHTFNKSFSGQENIYYDADDNGLSTTSKSFKNLTGVGSLWESMHDTTRESKHNKLFKIGGRKFTQVAQGCRSAISNLSQKFKNSTQRRYKLDSNSPKHSSFSTPPHGTIRRTPGKLYTPFNCQTPPGSRNIDLKRLQCKTPRSFNYDTATMRITRTPQHRRSVHSRLGPNALSDRDEEGEQFYANNSLYMSNSKRRSTFNDTTYGGDHASLLAPSVAAGLEDLKRKGTFRRHLVEFNQMSRNFNRNNKFRNSVR